MQPDAHATGRRDGRVGGCAAGDLWVGGTSPPHYNDLMGDRTAAAVLAALCAALSLMCAYLAFQYASIRAEAECLRGIVEDGAWPAEGDCRAQ